MKELFRRQSLLGVRVIVVIYLILYISFLFMDLKYGNAVNNPSYLIKYMCILLNFLIALFIGDYDYSKYDKIYLITALFFTALADFTLTFIGNYTLGVLFFCIVQLSYIKRHSKKPKDKRNNIILISLFLLTNFFITFNVNNVSLLYLKETDRKLLFIAAVYFSLLLTSLIRAFSVSKSDYYSDASKYFIFIGMILFFLCDINVGVYNVLRFMSGFPKDYFLKNVTGFLIWFFYAPSQLLLALSGYNIYGYKKEHTK
ncbi:lysoplasmalogenase family protein [Clostridium lundense]|uniref:lysoplasmalogenase family protein n=1 Tax=Clostridium lundense TaxID=319475 RepID=UPI000480D602|nr:lysoplasmalogenase family protein [Clostridium lundense]